MNINDKVKVSSGVRRENVEYEYKPNGAESLKNDEYLNAYDLDAAMKIVAGTAKNMGVKVEGIDA